MHQSMTVSAPNPEIKPDPINPPACDQMMNMKLVESEKYKTSSTD